MPTTSFMRGITAVLAAVLLAGAPGTAGAQETGSIRGHVAFERTGDPVHGAVILVVGIGRTATTGAGGEFEIRNVPAGTYDVLAQRQHLSTARQRVTVGGEAPAELVFRLAFAQLHEELTVTANPTGEATTFEAFNSIQSLDAFEIARGVAPSIAGVVERVPGVDVRSFGPGSERPIIRGFDGDRVLILEDGVRTGDLSSQSGDHGTTLEPGALERVEVVRGPATLLYGSNAIGGVVHALTPHESLRRTPFTGLRGQVLTDGGTGNGQAGLNGNVQYGQGNWMLWAGGGSRRTTDYRTPDGTVENSASRMTNGRAGIGFNGSRGFFSVGYGTERGRYGIPFAGEFHSHEAPGHGHHDDDHDHDHDGEDHDDHDHDGDDHDHDLDGDDHDDRDHDADDHGSDHDHDADHDDHEHGEHEELFIDLKPMRHTLRVDMGLRDLGNRFADSVRFVVSRLDWRHDEIEIEGGFEELGTRFNNTTTTLRAEVEQRRIGRLSGRFGLSTEFRDYEAVGVEALAPATTQRAIGVFAYEQLDLGPARLMFGGRVDRTAYDTDEREGPSVGAGGGHVHGADGILAPATRDRSYTGGSGSVGLHVDLGARSALVTTLTRSYRAPALEELYNFGPHFGNLAFEIGNTNLDRESSIGVDVSLRHRSPRARGEFNAFVYAIDDFVFPSASQREMVDGLFVTEYLQSDSRFTGFDTQAGVGLHERLWLNVGAGYVQARLTALDEYVPRIPPLHARLSLDVPFGGITVSPEIVWTAKQDRVFRNETETEGYTLLNLNATYLVARSHYAHVFNLTGRNLTDERYRRHTSFIKDLAPEMGRSVRVSYGIRFF